MYVQKIGINENKQEGYPTRNDDGKERQENDPTPALYATDVHVG